MMALKLWAAFSVYGIDGMGQLVDEAYAKAKLFAEKINARPHFQLLMAPETNIVCFRYLEARLAEASLNHHQSRSGSRLFKVAPFTSPEVDLHGITWLRTTLMNPFTTAEDLDQLLIIVAQISQMIQVN
jgi:L-2,4-diaminobutyrate decarboxylase